MMSYLVDRVTLIVCAVAMVALLGWLALHPVIVGLGELAGAMFMIYRRRRWRRAAADRQALRAASAVPSAGQVLKLARDAAPRVTLGEGVGGDVARPTSMPPPIRLESQQRARLPRRCVCSEGLHRAHTPGQCPDDGVFDGYCRACHAFRMEMTRRFMLLLVKYGPKFANTA